MQHKIGAKQPLVLARKPQIAAIIKNVNVQNVKSVIIYLFCDYIGGKWQWTEKKRV